MTVGVATIVLDEADIRIPATAYTLDGFRSWAHSDKFPECGKITYVQGEVCVDMSPEELQSHNLSKGDVFGWLWGHVRENDLGRIFADGALLVNDDADLATEPDITYCSWESIKSGRVELREMQVGSGRKVELYGSPDLIVEVISRGSVKKDTKLLREAYHSAKVREYWIVDARGSSLKFTPLQWRPKRYVETASDAEGWVTSRVLDRLVKLTRTRDRMGGWHFRLHLEPIDTTRTG